ncbi:hypothetical protein BDV93DRAFT_515743 [Ceratobasidium sp. AG-I]|nr:hypothetical protein BDV93DRAFT_515743 [Ceratobasidium sp. AG-I]
MASLRPVFCPSQGHNSPYEMKEYSTVVSTRILASCIHAKVATEGASAASDEPSCVAYGYLIIKTLEANVNRLNCSSWCSRSFRGLVPLPGMGELEGAVKSLIDVLKSSGYNNKQCDLVANRFERLLRILRPAEQLEGVQSALRQLAEIKDTMETGLKRKLPAGTAGAQHRLEVLDTARSQINELMTDTLLQLSVDREVESSNQTQIKQFEGNLEVIPEYKIVKQELVQSITTRMTLSCQAVGPTFETVGNSECSVTICRRIGYFGNLRVSYRTFSSPSDDAAAQRVKMELKVLSKALHPSVAVLVGVTKGYHGLNGVISAMGGLPYTEFRSNPMSGAVLARCVREMQEVDDFFRDGSLGEHLDCKVDDIAIDHSGHVTVLPRPARDRYDSLDGIEPHAVELLSPNDCNAGANLALLFYCQAMNTYIMAGNDFPLTAQRALNQTRIFLKKLSEIRQTSVTELEVLKLATEHGLDPLYNTERLWFNSVPPLTMKHGDLGRYNKQELDRNIWVLFEEANDVGSDSPKRVGTPDHLYKEDLWESAISVPQEYSSWVTYYADQVTGIEISQYAESPTWRDALLRHYPLSKLHTFINSLSFCRSLHYTVVIQRPDSEKTEKTVPRPLYFHRSPSNRSNLQQYWGFFSANANPCTPNTGLEELGWTFEYRIESEFIHLCNDWGQMYARAQREGVSKARVVGHMGYIEEPEGKELKEQRVEEKE